MTKVYILDILENKIDVELLINKIPINVRKRFDKYSIFEDKIRSVVSYYLLNKYLKKDFFIDLKECDIKENEYGKPYIVNSGIKFNISHSNSLVSLIISDDECGIDIEIIDTNKHLNIAKKVLTKDEYEIYLLSKDNELFVTKWTIIEAYNKMLGLGINNLKLIYNNISEEYIIRKIQSINEENYILIIFSKDKTIKINKVSI